ncbi:helix-turn-helix domain-containing protein [Paenibacillus sp. y28]|uniref:helix-turn-helix domain-containing protein n=1 Tax=Paenibacillus sp. y28 TaxID=3129110 RepID=UPI0030159FF6
MIIVARGPKASELLVSDTQREILEQLIRRRSTSQSLAKRVRLVLEAAGGLSNTAIGGLLPMDRPRVVLWRKRWIEQYLELCQIEQAHPEELEAAIVQLLSDQPRPGTPPTFTEQQVLQIVAIACEDPSASGRSISHWTSREVRDEAIKRGIVASISVTQVGRFLK